MKSLFVLLAAGTLAHPLMALETGELSAVAGKFAGASPDQQYEARVEINRLVNQATGSENGDRAAVTKTVLAVLAAPDTPAEAKKYLLRALGKVGTPEAVPALTGLLDGSDAILKEEARLALERLPGDAATGALEAAFARAADKREKLCLANSLAARKAVSAIPALSALAAGSDPELARAGIAALARVGGPESVEALKKIFSGGKLPAGLKPEVEKALLLAAGDDPALAAKISAATECPAARLAAFKIAISGADPGKETLLKAALKSDDLLLRQTALRCGLQKNLEGLPQMLVQSMNALSPDERVVVLASIDRIQPADAAEKIALDCAASEVVEEKAAALAALGRFDSKSAFETILRNISARERPVSNAACDALAILPYPDAEAELSGMLKGDSSEDKILAVKALAFRHIDGAGAALLGIVKGDNEAAAREALKTLYEIAGENELGSLADMARAASDPAEKKLLASVCARIAERLESGGAKALVKELQ